jgi:hypothetical protein
LADTHDPPRLDPDVGLGDSQHRIHHDHGGDHHVERPVGIAQPGHLAHSVSQRLAASVDRFLAWQQQASLDLGDQTRVGQPEPVTHGRTV